MAGRLRDENRFVVPSAPPRAFPGAKAVVSARRISLTPPGPRSSVDHRNPPLRLSITASPADPARAAGPSCRRRRAAVRRRRMPVGAPPGPDVIAVLRRSGAGRPAGVLRAKTRSAT